MSTATLAALLERADVTQPELAAHLDTLASEDRVAHCRALSGKLQKRLWQVCAGAPAFTLEHLVPPSVGEGSQVIWAGKNSLPLFTVFEKRFQRFDGAVVGYNFTSTSFVAGPGYFTVVQSPHEERELLFDYTRVPSAQPSGWPEVRSNARGLSHLIYKNLHDFCRRVSDDVIIGSATRLGKDMDSYFVLARAA